MTQALLLTLQPYKTHMLELAALGLVHCRIMSTMR